jgi:hypothetical protein
MEIEINDNLTSHNEIAVVLETVKQEKDNHAVKDEHLEKNIDKSVNFEINNESSLTRIINEFKNAGKLFLYSLF